MIMLCIGVSILSDSYTTLDSKRTRIDCLLAMSYSSSRNMA